MAAAQTRIDAKQAKAAAKMQEQPQLFAASSDTPLSPAELAVPEKLESPAGAEKRVVARAAH